MIDNQAEASNKGDCPKSGRQGDFRHQSYRTEGEKRRVNRDPRTHQTFYVFFDVVVCSGGWLVNKPKISPHRGKTNQRHCHHHGLLQLKTDDRTVGCRENQGYLQEQVKGCAAFTMISSVF